MCAEQQIDGHPAVDLLLSVEHCAAELATAVAAYQLSIFRKSKSSGLATYFFAAS